MLSFIRFSALLNVGFCQVPALLVPLEKVLRKDAHIILCIADYGVFDIPARLLRVYHALLPVERVSIYPSFVRIPARGIPSGSLVDINGIFDVCTHLHGIAVHLMGNARTQAPCIDRVEVGDLVLYIALGLCAYGFKSPIFVFFTSSIISALLSCITILKPIISPSMSQSRPHAAACGF